MVMAVLDSRRSCDSADQSWFDVLVVVQVEGHVWTSLSSVDLLGLL